MENERKDSRIHRDWEQGGLKPNFSSRKRIDRALIQPFTSNSNLSVTKKGHCGEPKMTQINASGPHGTKKGKDRKNYFTKISSKRYIQLAPLVAT